MDTTTLVAIVLIMASVLGLGYGGFNYSSETHDANIGALLLGRPRR